MKRNLKKYIALIKEGSFYSDGENVKIWNEKERDTALLMLKVKG